MRLQLGITMCLLAGCVVQPTVSDPRTSTGPNRAITDAGPGPLSLIPRIGIEHLPPDEATSGSNDAPLVEGPSWEPPRPQGEPRERPAARRESVTPHTWAMSANDLAAVDDPIARETLQFVQDLVDADQRRVRDEIGLPFLALGEATDFDRGPLLHSEEALLAAQEEWAQTHGPSLLRRPLQQLLRRLPLVRQVELEFDDFRSDHVPLTEPYRDVHGDRRSLGRFSLRVRASDSSDPVEVAYVHSGIRIGTSQDRARLSVDWDLSPTLRLEFRTSTEYETSDHGLRVDLAYRPTFWTSVHVAVGDDMDFLSTSSIYSLFETPMDGSAGLVLYAVHVF